MDTIKTSISHPIRIDEVNMKFPGRIGMTFCPGKKQPNAASGTWDRDLTVDLKAIKDWGASILVTVMEENELYELAVPQLPEYASRMGLTWIHLPVKDFSIPSPKVEKKWRVIAKELKQRLHLGQNIVFHCKGGLGRTGTMVACLLKELGVNGQDAICMVRQARPGTIENIEQELYVLNYIPSDGSS